jgi:hypothetical protein
MKKLIMTLAFALCLGGVSEIKAQKPVKKAANKTAEVASKGKSKVAQTRVKDRMGPNGETIYINKNGQYYWIDKKGRKHYINENQLKNKS